MPSSFRRTVAATIAILVFSSIVTIVPASGAQSPRISHPWISQAADPAAVADALAVNADKIPVEFRERLRWTLPDGTLRVMVTLLGRNSDVEAFVDNVTTWVHWYGDAPRFLGRVTQEQLVTLLDADVVTFVEPDYPITNFMATSTLDVHARSIAPDPTAVWWFDPAEGPMGALKSNVPGLSADQVTGAGVTVAVTDSGVDRTHRDFGGWDCEAGPYQPCESRITRAVSVEHMIDAGADPGDSLPTTEFASGHGTHVAGTIAGNGYYTRDGDVDPDRYGADGHNFGVAPQANLISTKNGDTLWAGLSNAGLQWQLDHADEYGIRVSSNSWGCLGGCSFNGNSATGQLFRDMHRAGIVVVFAVGNDGGNQSGTRFSGYAQSPYVLGVANYDDTNHFLASTSSRGSDNTLPDAATWTPESEPVNGERRPDVGAPGTSIWSARTLTGGVASGAPRTNINDVTGGQGSGFVPYALMSGTSMATPHVAGAAAVLFSACPAATPVDVMRAVMAGADANEIFKTSGGGIAEPFEVGHGSLEVRRSVDWLMNQTVCGGTGGGTDPTPTPTVTPTAEPTPEPGTATKYYLHSVSGLGNVDFATGDSTFDTSEPTFETFASYYDNGPLINSGAVDPAWVGTIGGKINALEVDFWQWSPIARAQARLDYQAAINVGGTIFTLPIAEQPAEGAITNEITRFTHKWTTMLENGAEVPLSIDPGTEPVTIMIRGAYLDVETFTEVVYDSTEFPSSFTVFTGGGSTPTPTPTATPQAEATEVAFTEASATAVQYSDDAVIEAVLTSDGDPVANEDLVFELTGGAGTREWTVTTDDSGLASERVTFTDEPGSYQLTARYAGRDDAYLPSADTTGFVVDRDDSATSLEVTGRGNDRGLASTTTDDDSGAGLAGVTVEFFADGRSMGTATTDSDGAASTSLPPKYRNGHHAYEVVFEGNTYYKRSSARQQT